MTNNKIYFIANWKMYGNLSSVDKINKVIKISNTRNHRGAKIIYCPPYTLINDFVRKTKKSKVSIGAQNCHSESNKFSFTGSISARMIKKLGAKYVIIGHSENRNSGDTDILINKKIKSSLKEKLNVIFCIGETLAEKKKNKADSVIKRQLKKGLYKIKNLENIIIAYEPVWSIGTGKIPKTKDLEKQIINIKLFLSKKFKSKKIQLLYGGSVNPKNVINLSKIPQINGFLIGGASHNQNKFIDIIKKTIN